MTLEVVADWEVLQGRLARVRRSGSDFSTSLFASRDQFDEWANAGPLRLLAIEGAVLLLRKDREFTRVHHVSADPSALEAVLQRLPRGTYVGDLIGRGDALDRVTEAYSASGFAVRSFLSRMVRFQSPGHNADGAPMFSPVEVATPADAREVAGLIERLLDKYVERVPGEAELAAAAAHGRLFIARAAGKVVGMLSYDLTAETGHLRYWHVDPDARGSGVGGRLMAEFLARAAQVRRVLLWVIGTNERSIAIYRHYGFEEDGLLDRIMLLHKE